MAVVLANHHLLLQEVKDASSQFALDTPTANKYTVAYCNPEVTPVKPGQTVYLLDVLGKLEIEGTEYVVAEPEQVVAYVA